jgi:hypothetical protein
MKTQIFRIKFLLSGLTLTVIMGLFFFSCQKDEITPTNEPFDYEQIGIEHNKGLDYVFEYLKEEKVGKKSNLKNATNILSLAEKATVEFLNKNRYFNTANKKTATERAIKVFNTYKDFSVKNKLKSATSDKLWTDDVDNLLTDNQKVLLSEINSAISDLKLDLQSTLSKLDAVEIKTKIQCPEKEQFIVLAAISISRHSLRYWHDNYEKWMIELGSVDKLMTKRMMLKSGDVEDSWWSWKSLTKADTVGLIAGATGGAAGGAVLGAFVGGVGAGPGAMAGAVSGGIGGAVGGSVGSAVGQLWDKFM